MRRPARHSHPEGQYANARHHIPLRQNTLPGAEGDCTGSLFGRHTDGEPEPPDPGNHLLLVHDCRQRAGEAHHRHSAVYHCPQRPTPHEASHHPLGRSHQRDSGLRDTGQRRRENHPCRLLHQGEARHRHAKDRGQSAERGRTDADTLRTTAAQQHLRAVGLCCQLDRRSLHRHHQPFHQFHLRALRAGPTGQADAGRGVRGERTGFPGAAQQRRPALPACHDGT